ncbi:hypothetical protein [Streptomyces sp. TLI_171]|nr:hypothetical protein [Streptomyces sp. TLI_171]RKE18921.1 hypothetical protein BX266_2217 [Streptomyces sp. TLI_171]
MLLFALLSLGLLAGAAAHLPAPLLLVAATVVAGWLLAFGARERLGRR